MGSFHLRNVRLKRGVLGFLSGLGIWLLLEVVALASPVSVKLDGDPTPSLVSRNYLPHLAQSWPFVPPFLDHLVISEIMYDPVADQPDGEWIEVYNHTSQTFDLRDYKIGDEESLGGGEGMLRFPKGMAIAPEQILVIAGNAQVFFAEYGFLPDYEMRDSGSTVPDMEKYAAWAGGNVNLTNTGDEMILLDLRDKVSDAVSWGDSGWDGFISPVPRVGKGHSLERFPGYIDTDTGADWIERGNAVPGQVDLSTPTPLPTLVPTETGTLTPGPSPTPTLTSTPFQAALLISEILYDSRGEEPQEEWFEIFNASGMVVDLSGFKVGDEETRGGSEGLFAFPQDAQINPGEVLIIADQAFSFTINYGFSPDFEVVNSDPSVPDLIKFIDWASGSISLNNNGDELLLLDPEDYLVEAVSWGSSIWAFNPSIPNVSPGHSIERFPPNSDSNTAQDWRDQSLPDPGVVDLSTPTSTFTPTPTKTPTATPTPSSTWTPTMTPSPSVTDGPSPSPTFTSTPTPSSTAFAGSLFLSEVLYDPEGTEPYDEWIEIYNSGAEHISLSGFKIGDDRDPNDGTNEGMMTFPEGATISSTQFVVIANRADEFFASYGFNPDFEMAASDPTVPNMIKYEIWAGGNIQLNNNGDDVLLLDPADNQIDAVSYGDSDWAFSPAVPSVLPGHSIERYPPNGDSDSADDWRDQNVPNPGTGGVNKK